MSKILFVWPSAENSIYDVGLGYRAALEKAGCNVYDWKLYNRLKLLAKAFDYDLSNLDVPVWESPQVAQLSWHASRMIVEDVVDYSPDWVLIISGMGFHPIALEYLQRMSIPTAVVFTESPYNEEHEQHFAQRCDIVATNEKTTAERNNWIYLPPAIDPERHNSDEVGADIEMDVCMVGTAWKERIQLLMGVDWEGIDLRLFGVWPQLSNSPNLIQMRVAAGVEDDPEARAVLGSHYYEHITANWETAAIYARSKICLNDHRNLNAEDAVSVNPRCMEVLGVGGGLLLTDWRNELVTILGNRAREFSYRNSEELNAKIHYFLANEAERRNLVEYGQKCVLNQTFDARVSVLLQEMDTYKLAQTSHRILATIS